MDTGTESGGGDAFAARVMKKAREVQHAAVQSRAYEIGDGGPTTLDRGEELAMYGTQTGKVTGGDVLPGSRGWKGLEEWYSWIPSIFEPFTKLPDPASFDPIISSFDLVISQFGGHPDDPRGKRGDRIDSTIWGNMDSVANNVMKWHGRAAATFDEFSDPFQYIPHNHCALAHVLSQSTKANQQIFKSARDDIFAIADAAIVALGGQTSSGGTDVSFNLTVVAAVAGFVAAVPSFGATLPIWFAAVAAGAAVGAELAPKGDNHKENKLAANIRGNTTDTILDSMVDSVKRFERLVEQEEDKIVRILRSNLEVVNSKNSQADIVAPRPDLANLRSGEIDSKMGPPLGRPN